MPRLKTSGAILPPHTPSWRVLGKTSRSTSKTSLQIKRLFAKSVVLLQVSCCPFGIFRFIFIIWYNAETMCDWSRTRVRWGSNGCQNIPLMRIKLKNTSQQDSSNILGQYFVSGVHISDTWTPGIVGSNSLEAWRHIHRRVSASGVLSRSGSNFSLATNTWGLVLLQFGTLLEAWTQDIQCSGSQRGPYGPTSSHAKFMGPQNYDTKLGGRSNFWMCHRNVTTWKKYFKFKTESKVY